MKIISKTRTDIRRLVVLVIVLNSSYSFYFR